MNIEAKIAGTAERLGKFQDPDWTAKGEARAQVALGGLETLWFNTGTVCNIACVNCYIESTPTNDRLVYLALADVTAFLDEIAAAGLGTREIGFTGGEPFMNPEIIAMLETALQRGHEVLVLTNAMQPMQRKRVQAGLLDLVQRFGDRLTLRVSLDHYAADNHDSERGRGAFAITLKGMDWLAAHGFRLAIAGRTCWHESEPAARAGYAALIGGRNWPLDAADSTQVVLFPEMDEMADTPEITTGCWGITGVDPASLMCAKTRMVVKRKGAVRATVLPCTLIPYDERFDMGATLVEAARADGGMFSHGEVKLCHSHCSRFCVLGGGSCS